MIAALLAAVSLSGAAVIENPDPRSESIVLQAVVGLPALEREEWAQLQVVADALAEGSMTYGRRELVEFGSANGQRPRARLGPDHLRIELSVLPHQLDIGLAMMASLLREPNLTEEGLSRAQAARLNPRVGWDAELWRLPVPTRVSVPSAMALARRVLRPERTVLGVGGAIRAGEAEPKWMLRIADFPAAPRERPTPTAGDAPLPSEPGAGLTYAELRSAPFAANDAALATRWLAVTALGHGKGSSAFRVLRERQGWSYRQEAWLWPTLGGWRVRMVMAVTPGEDGPKWPDRMRAALEEDVRSWTAADLERAREVARRALGERVFSLPLYLPPSGVLSDSVEDETFLRAYLLLKTGRTDALQRWTRQLEAVRLEDLREAALGILATSLPVVR